MFNNLRVFFIALNLCKPFGMYNILQQQNPQFRCTICEHFFLFVHFVLNLLTVSFEAILSQTRKGNNHLDLICFLNVTHHFIYPIIVPISRLSQTESLGLQSLIWKSFCNFNHSCSSFCYQFLRSGKLWYLFCSLLRLYHS